MKFALEATNSYDSIPPVYLYSEQFNNNLPIYHEGTKWFGIFLAFLSGTFFTLSSALVKAIRNVDPMVLLGIRACFQMTLMLICGWRETNIFGPKGQRLLIHFQGFVGGITLALLYYSFRKLPLGDATTIIFSSPVIVIALSFIFLREPCGVLRIAVITALLTGVILVSRPPFIFETSKLDNYDPLGYTCALLATVFTALNIVVMRKCVEIHYAVIVFNLSGWTLISATTFYLINSQGHINFHLPHDWFTWGQIILVVVTGLSGQVLVAKALKIEGAGKVSVTRSLDIILAYVCQIYFFDEVPTLSNISGAMLILLSVICMGFEREIYGVCDFIP
ncbi:solute carrier family 35 member G1-like [Leptopilina heterotoma]|uniref:solute carrier family 35 member G1-like n=1 Tax=Leptopilina heterotoma TaxID=63436 RepID=UPI001CAA2E05|nr:solute carrier family 35 member G1-like [Leptopilina heterotoma]